MSTTISLKEAVDELNSMFNVDKGIITEILKKNGIFNLKTK